ncbi:MAG: hypothetical protein EBZ77_05310, partial [Chitinophagia bacterium]|nr:hypothetical protein [Chitinophagia bacterium]
MWYKYKPNHTNVGLPFIFRSNSPIAVQIAHKKHIFERSLRHYLKKIIYIIALLLVAVVTSAIYKQHSGYPGYPFDGDALGYYRYLPATFIYHHPLDQDTVPTRLGLDSHTYYCLTHMPERTPIGHGNNQYTYGIALMEAPFFLIAHVYDLAAGGRGNGYSAPYLLALHLCSLFYCLAGLLLIYLSLRKFFPPLIGILVVVILYIGTNTFWFTLTQVGMSHIPLFALYSALIYLTICLHECPKRVYFVLLGFFAGIITVVRPVDVVCLLIPLLYNVHSRATNSTKWLIIANNSGRILMGVAAFILPIAPQLLYWKLVAGKWIYYSYLHQSFNWKHPHIIDGLLSANNGWLVYSPVMIAAVAGMFFFRSLKQWKLLLWVLLPLYSYIIYSWYCYNYINGLGSRPMIHMYPLLAFPLATFLTWLSKKNLVAQFTAGSVLAVLCAANISYSYLQANRLLISEESNYFFNLSMLFRTHLTYN